MHDRVLRWIHSHPWVTALGVVILGAEGIAFVLWASAPMLDAVLSGPDPEVCRRAEQTGSPRDIAACCAAESSAPRAVCEGSAAERRREAQDQEALRTNQAKRERWEQRAPAHYRYSFRFMCFMCPGAGTTYTSEVRDGVPTVTAPGEGSVEALRSYRQADNFATMEKLFDMTEWAIQGNPYAYVTYSSRWGYPRELSWGRTDVTDSVTTLEVIDFEVLP